VPASALDSRVMKPQISAAPAAFRSKSLCGLLALVAGSLGAHRMYLGASWWWIYPAISMPTLGLALASDDWIRHPAFFVALLVFVETMLEAILISLTRDERWDARWNADVSQRSDSRWGPVLVAIAALMLGATALMSVLAIALETYFSALQAGVR
jgi:hypothetical protein